MIDFLVAIFLGFVEGLTEFLPVSSTGHLILLTEGLDFPSPEGFVFEVLIQLGAIMAVVVLYRKKFWDTAIGITHDPVARRFALNIFLGMVPALVLGYFFHGFIKNVLYSPHVIATTLVLGGIIILLVDKRFTTPRTETIDDVSPKQAFLIGCFQSIALIPGVSRSGATIIGALGLGLSRKAAAEFSFFLAVPIMICAVVYDVFKNWEGFITYPRMDLVAAGLLSAFITAMVVIKAAMAVISHYGFTPFAYYRILVGLAAFFIFW